MPRVTRDWRKQLAAILDTLITFLLYLRGKHPAPSRTHLLRIDRVVLAYLRAASSLWRYASALGQRFSTCTGWRLPPSLDSICRARRRRNTARCPYLAHANSLYRTS